MIFRCSVEIERKYPVDIALWKWIDMMKRLLTFVVAVLLVGGSGCVSSSRENGMLSPRSGELFQTTRIGPGRGTLVCSALMLGGLFAHSEGRLWGLPVAVVGLPFAASAFVVDACVVSPLTDLVCLPYDLCQPHHGFYLRIVDEDGKPVAKATIEGMVKGRTDDAGEFHVGRLFNLRGSIRASAEGHLHWPGYRHIDLSKAKETADGRLVLEFVLVKGDLGTWAPKTDLSREEVLKLLPGKWSADAVTRKFLAKELGWPSADDSSRHCLTLLPSQAVESQVPESYHLVRSGEDPWRQGSAFVRWQLDEKWKVKLSWRIWEPKGWKWGVRLLMSEGDKEEVYFLGEDEKGVYLLPGLHGGCSCHLTPLKFRKVTACSPGKEGDCPQGLSCEQEK